MDHIEYVEFVLAITVILCLAVVIDVTTKRRSFKWFFISSALTLFGVLLPLFTFGFSIVLAPEAKVMCHHGWLDCFIVGKLALTPLVLWAVAAWGKVEIYRTPDRTKLWIVLGYFTGAVVSSVCAILGPFIFSRDLSLWLLVPGYVAVWYWVRAVQLMKEARLNPILYFATLAGSLPFWIGAIIWSRRIYQDLPEDSTCFIVTAATRGHPELVGPFTTVNRSGKVQNVNRQLLTLWSFEARWQARSPRSHRCFRRVYNRIGPKVAKRIRFRWQADFVYLAIKPVEWVVELVFLQNLSKN